MKLPVEAILANLRKDPNYFRYVRNELKEDVDFAILAVLTNPYLYFKFPFIIQNNEEVIQAIIDSASTEYLNFPYGQMLATNDQQKEQLRIVNKKRCFMQLYSDICPNISIPNNLKLCNLDLNSDMFLNLELAYEDLTPREKIVIDLHYGLNNGIPMRCRDIAASMCVNSNSIRQVDTRGIRRLARILEKNDNKQYKIEK